MRGDFVQPSFHKLAKEEPRWGGSCQFLLQHSKTLSVLLSTNMATRWGICGAGKISHDFSVAMKTLPAGEHQITAVAARSLLRLMASLRLMGATRSWLMTQILVN
ncbi:hypothetical protein SRHO_G00083740 [Serrasalmus rhombeus]